MRKSCGAEKEALLSMYGAAMMSLDAMPPTEPAPATKSERQPSGMMGEDFPQKGPLQIGYSGCELAS